MNELPEAKAKGTLASKEFIERMRKFEELRPKANELLEKAVKGEVKKEELEKFDEENGTCLTLIYETIEEYIKARKEGKPTPFS